MKRDDHSGHIPFLDGIKAVAVLIVVAGYMITGVWSHIHGYLGVTLFFVLSGYLITTIALQEEYRDGTISFRAFYIRRAFRIFPLYYLVVGVYCILILILGQSPSERPAFVHALPYFLIYLQELINAPDLPFQQSWSLGIEEKFYLIWPVIAFGLLGSRKNLRIPVAALIAAVCIAIGSVISPYSSILFGCLLALILQNGAAQRAIADISPWGTYFFLIILLFVHVLVVVGYIPNGRTLYAIVFTFLLAFLLNRQSSVTDLLTREPLVAMGKWSYAVYLVHRLCRNMIARRVHDANLIFLLTCILSFAVAAILAYTIEQPWIRFGNRLAMQHKEVALAGAGT